MQQETDLSGVASSVRAWNIFMKTSRNVRAIHNDSWRSDNSLITEAERQLPFNVVLARHPQSKCDQHNESIKDSPWRQSKAGVLNVGQLAHFPWGIWQ